MIFYTKLKTGQISPKTKILLDLLEQPNCMQANFKARRYSEVKIHYLKYFGMLPSSVNLLLFIKIFYFTIFNKNHFYNNY